MAVDSDTQKEIDAMKPLELTTDGMLRYRLYSQDGKLIEMACQNTHDMERFVRWTRRFDRQ